jgi:hypothetical protein
LNIYYFKDHFEFDYAAGVKWVCNTLGERWRAYKYKLRCQQFYPNKTKEEILANCPSNVSPAEWASFVHHYTKNQMKVYINLHVLSFFLNTEIK